jgi:hypothetical protein
MGNASLPQQSTSAAFCPASERFPFPSSLSFSFRGRGRAICSPQEGSARSRRLFLNAGARGRAARVRHLIAGLLGDGKRAFAIHRRAFGEAFP